MSFVLDAFKLLSDPTRLRILLLLDAEELSVAEMQDILGMKQSRISTQLSLLKQADLVQARRSGKNSIYGLVQPDGKGGPRRELRDLLRASAAELPEAAQDQRALRLALTKRTDKARAYFDQLAGKFGRSYCPGRSWKALAETLLKLMPRQVIADLGAGEGTFSQLLAQRAQRVIAVDNSDAMVAFGTQKAAENGFSHLEYRKGDLQAPPIGDAEVDLAFFSQALHHARRPDLAVREAFRITRPGGRIVILDLLKHEFEQARDLYQDVWLGFADVELYGFLEAAGWKQITVSVVDREAEPPHFATILALAEK
ncbi:MAG: metalloregulator ArsR/SmtB family transcription factor [Verrucomicrobiales bacterium]|nr:metalloregulator ArsR/SmtB family transcription factor [Verrucomicrobiales bacterium]